MLRLATLGCAIAAATALAVPLAAQHQGHPTEPHHDRSDAPLFVPQQGELTPAARRQIAQVRRGIARYRDIEVAKREGWKAFGADEPLMGQHWSPPEDFDLDYQGSNPPLDFARPNNLMYTEIDGEMVLTGAAFVVRLGPGEALPSGFAGSADKWHVHDFQAAWQAATEKRPILRWIGNWWLENNWLADGRARAAMVHVWASLPNPDGPFADHNRILPLLKHGIDAGYARSLSLDAARGLDLAAKDGCDNAYGGRLWIADVSRRTKRTIMRTCKAEAKKIAASLEGHRNHPEHLFGDAAQSYARVQAVFERELTPEQQRRIAMMSEHGHGDEHDGHGAGHQGHRGH